MSIGRRFWNVARTELNALLDKAKDLDDGDPGNEGTARRWDTDDVLSAFSEAELAAELERRQRERDAERRTQKATGAARSSPRANPRPSGGEPGSDRRTASTGRAPGAATGGDRELRKAYTALEVPHGSDLETVKAAYRSLMRKYHPDRHAGSPDAQKTANDLSQRLTQAYTLLKTRLERG